MQSVSTEWEEFPSVFELFCSIIDFLKGHYRDELIVKSETKQTWINLSTFDVCAVIILAVIWTLLRVIMETMIFKPLGSYYALTQKNQKKMPESAWKFVFYVCAFSYNYYVLIQCGEYHFFERPTSVWDGWSLTEPIPIKVYILYVGQCGYYLHSLYATLYLDAWRADSKVMLLHHFSTLLLISLSFILRCHNIGAFVLFFHDVCDIFLELSKLNVYFKTQNNRLVRFYDVFANISFLCFASSWIIARLYWFPLRVLYNSLSNVPYSLLMNSLLWVLQVLNFYWFYFILQVFYRVIAGKFQDGDDIREYDVQEEWNKKKCNGLPTESIEVVEKNNFVEPSIVMAYSKSL